MGENDLKIFETEFPDKWKYLTKKLANRYEYFISIDDNQKPVKNSQKEDFFSKLNNKIPSDSEIERAKDFINFFNIENGELTQPYSKSDVLLLACVYEKFIKVSFIEFDLNPLYCVSLPGYTSECGLQYNGIYLQTFQDKDSSSILVSKIRGGISSVMGDLYVKSDETREILYIDAINLYGNPMSQPLPYVEIEMWQDHPDL